MPAHDKLYDEIVRPAVDAVATLDVNAEPALRFAPLTRVDTRDTEDSDATC
jgi:hypothetical protein